MVKRRASSPVDGFGALARTFVTLVATVGALGSMLLTGCGDGSSPPEGTSPSTTRNAPTSAAASSSSSISSTEAPPDRTTTGASLTGEWFWPDGSGSVTIEDGPLVTFVDLDGSIVRGPYQATTSGDAVVLTLSQDDLVVIFSDDSGIETAELTFRPGDSDDQVVMETTTEFGDQPTVTLTREPPGSSPEG